MLEKLESPINLTKVIEAFDVNWESERESIVPGDKFLVKFCNNVGDLTYKKNEKNAKYLVGDLPKEDWPQSFIDVMNKVILKFKE